MTTYLSYEELLPHINYKTNDVVIPDPFEQFVQGRINEVQYNTQEKRRQHVGTIIRVKEGHRPGNSRSEEFEYGIVVTISGSGESYRCYFPGYRGGHNLAGRLKGLIDQSGWNLPIGTIEPTDLQRIPERGTLEIEVPPSEPRSFQVGDVVKLITPAPELLAHVEGKVGVIEMISNSTLIVVRFDDSEYVLNHELLTHT